jgi:hypothetical protein
MGWHIIKRLLQAVPILLGMLSRIEYQESNPWLNFNRSLGYARDGVCAILRLSSEPALNIVEGTASVAQESVKPV